MPTIGISLIAHNEEKFIEKALNSASPADKIVVVDCESTDNTLKLARAFPNVEVFLQPNNPNLNINKSFGFAKLHTDWIFYLDPDEQIPPPLWVEIRKKLNETPLTFSAYKIPRRNFFFGKPLLHGGAYPDYQIRLFQNGKAKFPNQHVHESLKVNGNIGKFLNPFDHHPYPDLSTYIKKMDFYTSFQSEFWKKERKKTNFFNTAFHFFIFPTIRFFRRFILKRGFLDGWQGFTAAAGDVFSQIFSYAKYLEILQNNSQKNENPSNS
ncbi:MAG: glycosyltransferase family 2 protein [Candidatus Riflebacteria bacterium]|nr:glycosyltransferase family 2 protein [Candidatus Riflebacteria bacterium]